MWCAARLPAERDPLWVIPAPSPQHAGPQSTGPSVGWRKKFRHILAYSDDFTHTAELATILQAIQCFEKAMGAQINPSKSKAMALGGWTAPARELEKFHFMIFIILEIKCLV